MRTSNINCVAAPAAVYLIHRTDRRRFKVGWAFNPLARAKLLPEFQRSQLDLRGSLALWLANRQRAQQVERAMHKCLAPYQVQAGHRGDGFSEWFAPAALPTAIQLLRQMPGEASAVRVEQVLKPLLPAQNEVVFADTERSPQDVWFEVEDLWLRLAALLPVRMEDRGGTCHLRFNQFRHATEGEMAELRFRALDVDTFTWRLGGESGAFVKLIAYEGDALVFTVTPIPTVVRWPQGDDLGWQVKGFISRMRVLQRDAVGVVSP
jgi:hypothetical protein